MSKLDELYGERYAERYAERYTAWKNAKPARRLAMIEEISSDVKAVHTHRGHGCTTHGSWVQPNEPETFGAVFVCDGCGAFK